MQSTELETQLLLNSLNTALVMVDEQLNIAFANHAGEALFETGKKQLVESAPLTYLSKETLEEALHELIHRFYHPHCASNQFALSSLKTKA